MNNELNIKSIGELLGYNFNIPSYQRGYRWLPDYQVKALLDDIWNYAVDNSNPKAFYCLQPVVVKAIGSTSYELIDGQQRLTTILLILHYFNETEFKTPKKHFSMQFETRIAQDNFLDIVTDTQKTASNIDLFHLNQAYTFISHWFEEKEETNSSVKCDFHSRLVNKTKVIWYEIKDNSSVIDIFTRLNIGKIPLTNAELVKALFLSKSSSTPEKESQPLKQLKIATEWDRIEQTLQNPEFWYFICNQPEKYDTRIEYVFDLMKKKKEDSEEYFTFYRFYEEFEKNKNTPKVIETIWLSIKEYFLTFEEWFHDRQLFHLIGYLVCIGRSIDSIKNDGKDIAKSEFKHKLKSLAKKSISWQLNELNFDEDKKEIRNTLLLFNILTIIDTEKSNLRFPFNHYHKQRWDIEHIRSQTNKDIKGKDKLNWAETVLDYFTGILFNPDNKESNEKAIINGTATLSIAEKDYCSRLLIILKEEDNDNHVFNSLYDDLTNYFKESQALEDIDNLSNLTLLDESTNRMYKNAFFPIKRKHIINKEKKGIFIPICTKNVFLKAYSKRLGEVMYWNDNDAIDYLEEIKYYDK